MNKYQQELLETSLEGRKKEVTEYQVNIDNYRLAIEEIGDDEALADFKARLADLLESSILEQKKANIMLTVIKKQLET